MRTGWADNPRLRDLVQRTDPGAHLIAEVVTVADSDAHVLQSEWDDGTVTGGSVEFLESGGARLLAGTTAEITQASDNGTEVSQLTHIPPFDALLIEWLDDGAEEREIRNIVARLHPRPDGGNPKDVSEWRCQLFRVVERGAVELIGGNRIRVHPISHEVVVTATGESASDVTFDMWDGNSYPKVGPGPSYLDGYGGTRNTRPLTVVRITAYDSEGNAADNVAWLADSTLGSSISGAAYSVTHYQAAASVSKEDEKGGTVWDFSATVANMPSFTLNKPSYTAATITYAGTGKEFNNLTGSGDIVVRARGLTPGGSTISYELWDGGAYVACKDGDVVGQDNTAQGGADLSGVPTTGPWDNRVILTPSSSGFSRPTAKEFGLERIAKTNLAGLARVRGGRSKIDPISLKGNIPKAEIDILKTGPRDYRDYGTEILAKNHIGDIEVRLWIGENAGTYLDRSEWMLHSVWEVEDFRNGDAAHTLVCHSPVRRLRTPVPEFVQTTGNNGTRTAITYANQTLKAVWDDLVDGRVGIPTRFRGPGVEDATTTVSKTIREVVDAKDELDRVAYLAGYANIESQGRIKAVPVMRDDTGGGTPVAFFPIGSYQPVHIGPGFATRTDEFFVPYDWDEDSGSFEAEARVLNATAVTKLGGAGLNTTQRLEDETARWIDSETLADTVARRVPNHFWNGLLVWEIRPIYLHPHLEVGDVVVVETNLLAVRSPLSDQELRGPVAALAIIVDTHGDVWGRHLSVWVPGFDKIVLSDGDITTLSFKKPKIEECQVRFSNAQLATATATFRTTSAGGVKADGDNTTEPSEADVRAESVTATDADGYVDITLPGTYALGDLCFVGAFAYEKSDGTGSESAPVYRKTFVRRPPQNAVRGVSYQWVPNKNALGEFGWNLAIHYDLAPKTQSVSIRVQHTETNLTPPPATDTIDHTYNRDFTGQGEHTIRNAADTNVHFYGPTGASHSIQPIESDGTITITPYDDTGGAGGSGDAGEPFVLTAKNPNNTGDVGTYLTDGVGGRIAGFELQLADGLKGSRDTSSDEPTLDYDLNALTEQATPVGSADFVLIYDAAAGAHRKTKLDDLPATGGADHGALTGLGDDDHSQYVHTSSARTISALHTFSHASGLKTDDIVERTAAAGVTIDGVVLKDGGVTATGDVISNSSDQRLKTDVRPLENALARVLMLAGFTYRWNELAAELCPTCVDPDEVRVGLFAQDVQAVLPEAVRPSPMGEGYLAFLPEMVLPLVVEAIRELEARVAELEA